MTSEELKNSGLLACNKNLITEAMGAEEKEYTKIADMTEHDRQENYKFLGEILLACGVYTQEEKGDKDDIQETELPRHLALCRWR